MTISTGYDRHELTDEELGALLDVWKTTGILPGSMERLFNKIEGILKSRAAIRAMPKPCGEIVLPGGGVTTLGTNND